MTKNSNYVASQHIFAVSLAFRNYLSTIWTFLQSFDEIEHEYRKTKARIVLKGVANKRRTGSMCRAA